jgi:hypothetical protein
MAKKSPPNNASMLPENHPLHTTIKDAYQVFLYPRPLSLDVCTRCCMDPSLETEFLRTPLRKLPLKYLQDWYQSAYVAGGISKGTWGYLLPRIFELLAADADVSPVGIEISLNRYQTGNSENWTCREWSVIDTFRRRYLDLYVDHSQDFLDDALCMFGIAGWSVEELLEQVAAVSDERLAMRLWRDWCGWPAPGNESIWITSFWENEGRTKAWSFYTSEGLYRRMEALALSDESNPALAEKALAVASVIEVNADRAFR